MSNPGNMSDLWKRLRFVLFAILVYRIGTHIPIPGINPDQIAVFFEDQTENRTILEMFNLFSGGALERMSIFALNVVPYISAAIIMQLFSNSIPYLQELKKDGQAGRNKITQYTRYGTALLAFIQASALAATLSAQEDFTTVSGALFFVPAVFSIVAGTMFLMWLGEQVSERGIGNGISIIIATSILTGIPGAIGQALTLSSKGELSVLVLLGIGLLSMAIIAVVVYVERGQRRITVNYAQRQQGRRLMQAQTSHLPLFPQFLQVLFFYFLLLYQHGLEKMIPQVFLQVSH
jgi:preprotein translocase subunit SecY